MSIPTNPTSHSSVVQGVYPGLLLEKDLKQKAALRGQMMDQVYKQATTGAYLGAGLFPITLVLANMGVKQVVFKFEDQPLQTQRVAEEHQHSKMKTLYRTCVRAPIVEEIIFRGLGRKLMMKGQEALGFDPNSTQSQLVRGGVLTVAFAAAHIDPSEGTQLSSSLGRSVRGSFMKVLRANKQVLLTTGAVGAVCHWQTERDKGNLVGAIATHTAYNTSVYLVHLAVFKLLGL